MPRKVITTRATSRLAEDPIEFAIAGTMMDGSTFVEEFTALPVLGLSTLDILGAATLNALDPERSPTPGDLSMIDRFFEQVLRPADFERFAGIIRAREYLIDVNDLREVIEYVVESLEERPTNGRPNSPGGSSNTPSTSAASSSSPAIRPLPSLPATGRARTSSPSRSRSTSTGSSASSTSTASSKRSKPASKTRTPR